jgi:exonuclease SbcD
VGVMRLVHAADLHLDSPLRGLGRLGDDAAAETLRAATRRALENLVELVLKERASLLLLAGDIYDGDWNDYGTGRFFARQMARLHDEGVRVVMISGNHDAESEITRSLRLPPNVTVLGVGSPESVRFEDLDLVVHGQGFATRAVTHNLATAFPDRTPGMVNVGLLHTSVSGQEGHERYAPCDLTDLVSKGYEYFALGHVHRHAVLSEGEHTVAYSGNLQGRNSRETGPKGALLVDLEPGRARLEFRALDVARWERLTVPVDECVDLDEVMRMAEERMRSLTAGSPGRVTVARILLSGRSAAAGDLGDTERLREDLCLIGERTGVTVEKVEVAVRPVTDNFAIDAGLLSEIRSAASARAEALRLLTESLRNVDREVGRLLREAGLVDMGDERVLTQIMSRAMDSLESQLAGGTK